MSVTNKNPVKPQADSKRPDPGAPPPERSECLVLPFRQDMDGATSSAVMLEHLLDWVETRP